MALTPGSPAPPDPPRARRPYLHIPRFAPTTPRTCPGLAGSPVSAGDTLTSYTTPRARRLHLPPPRARQLHLHPPGLPRARILFAPTPSTPASLAPPWALQLHPQPPELAGFTHPALGSPVTSAPTPGSLLHPFIFTCCGHAGSVTPTPGPLVHLYLPRVRQLHLHPGSPVYLSHKPTVKATMHNQVNISRDLPHLPHLPRASWYSPRDLSEPWRWAGIPRPVTACFFRVLTDCENQWGSSKLPQACLRT